MGAKGSWGECVEMVADSKDDDSRKEEGDGRERIAMIRFVPEALSVSA